MEWKYNAPTHPKCMEHTPQANLKHPIRVCNSCNEILNQWIALALAIYGMIVAT